MNMRSVLPLQRFCFSTNDAGGKNKKARPDGDLGPDREENEQRKRQNVSSYKKPDFLDDSYDHLASDKSKTGGFGAEMEDDDFLPDYMAKDAPTFKRNPVSINLPWLINGAPFNEIKTRFMGE